MLFSVLIPAYNVERYLHKCLDSVIAQTMHDYEIIIVDDGSTDSTGQICDEYKKKYPAITVIHKDNEGLLMARRDAIKIAKGEFSIFIDSDDYVSDAEAFQRVAKFIRNQPNVDVILMNPTVYSSSVGFVGKLNSRMPFKNNEVIDKQIIYKYLLTTEVNVSSMCGKIVRTVCLDKEKDYSNFKHLCYGEDLLQSSDVYSNAQNVIFMDLPFYIYRTGSGMMNKFNPNFFSSFKKIFFEIQKISNTWNLINIDDLLAVNYLNLCYSSVRQLKGLKITCEIRNYITSIMNDEVFREEYKRYRSGILFEFSLKEKLILWCLYNKNNFIVSKLLSMSKGKHE